MNVVMDPDVQRVMEFMHNGTAANRLVNVAQGVAALAPILWGRYGSEPVQALELECNTMCPAKTQSASNE